MKSSIGQKIRRIRASLDLTQDNLAYELGITKSAYSKIERGETNVSINRLAEIAKILEVDIVDFFKDPENTAGDPKDEYGFATKKDIEEMAKMIQSLAKEISTLKAVLPAKKSNTTKVKSKK
ncbi:helix-turn-helix domain-containing protein [Cytophaga aurantiaca]|uniref:helix-turn-helix domain-containing protein n=1 Tax=Cytophaga aurantiaca TaxID=29530 RepID=UPI00037536D8|nr:helix-turn-helix transcriptional regulator [Cytophaga aurantiaca]